MPASGIVRFATEPADLAAAATGTIIVSVDGYVLRRCEDTCASLREEPYWFDECPGCGAWEMLQPIGQQIQDYYATDQLFAETADDARILSRAACYDEPSWGMYHDEHSRRVLRLPFLIAYTPAPVDGGAA